MKNLLIGIAKVIGFFVAIPLYYFRHYARNAVYNYVLQNDKRQWLSRLWQRNPVWDVVDNGYVLDGYKVHDVPMKGFVHGRKVSKIEFYFVVFFIWGFLDDDCFNDTTDFGYIKTFYDGERQNHFIAPFVSWTTRKVNFNQIGGNSFDLGDIRDNYPFFNFWCTLFWNTRNLSMNFQYLFDNY